MILHTPVLLDQLLRLLVPPADDGVMVDATLGEGGHAEVYLSRYPGLFLIGVDADASIQEIARGRLSAFSDRVRLVNAWFGEFFEEYGRNGRNDPSPDLILMDLGISRFHYERSGRGFSFDKEEALDMRLGQGLSMTAADLVNDSSGGELLGILRRFGEEKFARNIVSGILRERRKARIETAHRLARIVADAVPAPRGPRKIHPATRTFQALRIAVNRELEELEKGLAEALRILKPGGRIGVIAFHSLEDRIVKRFLRERARGCSCPPEWPICQCGGISELRVLTAKPVTATRDEISRNPASRSAKLRVAQKNETRLASAREGR